jgi:hypothetical protein
MIIKCIAFAFCFYCSWCSFAWSATYYVSVSGDDITGTGSSEAPWATITHALDNVEDGSVVDVFPGTYFGRIRIRGSFAQGVTVRSQIPYMAKLRNDDTVITAYTHPDGVSGIRLEGFDIAHDGSGAGALVVHIDGAGENAVTNITLKNNILHDSYNNDILKINNACTNILVSGNIFYNQSGSDEHIDINSVSDVTVEGNVFFNDFEGSIRDNPNNTSSYIVIKDSNGTEDIFTGSRNITVRRNIFLNWQGSSGSNFILAGEDGQPFYEAYDVLVENNLMLGNSANVMRSAFGVKGCRDITFRNNTITGDLPSLAYAMRVNREGNNLANSNIRFYNNVWSDQSGTMGAESNDPSRNDFSDTNASDILFFNLDNNLYWNGGVAVPKDENELINYTEDSSGIIADPQLPAPVDVILPRWQDNNSQFADGSSTIRAVFQALVRYATPAEGSPVIDQANSAFAPVDDILGNMRPTLKDIGAIEKGAGTNVSKPLIPIFFLLL